LSNVEQVPKGVTSIALPFVSKQGFTGATTQSLILGILAGGMKMSKFLFLGDHSQVQARNVACQDAIDIGSEWIWFIDSDADFPVDALARLKACDSDIACTDMWSRNIPSFRTVMRLEVIDGDRAGVPVPGNPTGVEDIDLCGMHCTLIKVSLLKKIKDAFPESPWFWNGKNGEDAEFCFKAKDLGAKIKCDFSIMSGHWGVARMAGQDWSRDAKNQPMHVANMEMMKRMGVKNLKEEGVV
jgi:hypothetical protein